ncbi:futalosine hydrolase [Desulfocurvus vexinensis]|uniref:futalosine hydrolase n=1 Tax=Desulfocurvus vexinensis TaxID=399548 RepID=UPI0004B9A090|nr:futalosine hydrolase [Desulfocurvus vexinensis]
MLVLALATATELCAALPGAPPGLEPGDTAPVALPGRRALALVAGVGPVGAALRLGRLLGALDPGAVAGVLNLGVAGSFDTAALPLGAVAVAGRETWPEFGLRTQAGVDAAALGFPVGRTPAGPLGATLALEPDAAARAMGLALPAPWPRVHALTVAAASADAATASALRAAHGAQLESMEGYALALACLEAGLPFLEVRTVSNAVGTRRADRWDLPGALAALPGALAALCGHPGGTP